MHKSRSFVNHKGLKDEVYIILKYVKQINTPFKQQGTISANLSGLRLQVNRKQKMQE